MRFRAELREEAAPPLPKGSVQSEGSSRQEQLTSPLSLAWPVTQHHPGQKDQWLAETCPPAHRPRPLEESYCWVLYDTACWMRGLQLHRGSSSPKASPESTRGHSQEHVNEDNQTVFDSWPLAIFHSELWCLDQDLTGQRDSKIRCFPQNHSRKAGTHRWLQRRNKCQLSISKPDTLLADASLLLREDVIDKS